jgi:hypothetical protein
LDEAKSATWGRTTGWKTGRISGRFLWGSKKEMGEEKGKKLYVFLKTNTAILSDDMQKIGEANKQGYQIKGTRRLTWSVCPLHLARNCM